MENEIKKALFLAGKIDAAKKPETNLKLALYGMDLPASSLYGLVYLCENIVNEQGYVIAQLVNDCRDYGFGESNKAYDADLAFKTARRYKRIASHIFDDNFKTKSMTMCVTAGLMSTDLHLIMGAEHAVIEDAELSRILANLLWLSRDQGYFGQHYVRQ